MFERQLAYFIKHQDELVARHRGKYLVIVDDEVVDVHESALDAYLSAKDRFSVGSYMIQPCEPGPAAYTVTIAG